MEFTQLTITTTNTKATLLLNGFPIAEVKTSGFKSLPIDLYLLENNTLTIQATPEQNAHITLRIATVAQGTIVDTRDTSPALFNLDEDVPSEKTYNLTFATPGKTLGKRILGETITESQAIEYAKTLAQLIQNKKFDALAAHFQPKFEDYAKLYNSDPTKMTKEFSTFLNDFTFTYNQNAITAQPYCSERVYRLLHNNKTFITAQKGTGEYKLEIYIANVNGTIKVVR